MSGADLERVRCFSQIVPAASHSRSLPLPAPTRVACSLASFLTLTSLCVHNSTLQELLELNDDPLDFANCQPNGDDMNKWTVKILGQTGTPYEEGVFIARLKFSSDYPFSPPMIKFRTKIFHPNVAVDGEVCPELLQENWKPNLNIRYVLMALRLLLETPNGNVVVNEEAGAVFNSDIAQFNEFARQWTRKYAGHAGRM